MSNLFQLNLKDLGGAIISGVIIAALTYVASLANVFEIDWNQLVNVSVLAVVTSLLKALGTDENGKLLGKIQIK